MNFGLFCWGILSIVEAIVSFDELGVKCKQESRSKCFIVWTWSHSSAFFHWIHGRSSKSSTFPFQLW